VAADVELERWSLERVVDMTAAYLRGKKGRARDYKYAEFYLTYTFFDFLTFVSIGVEYAKN
jgi:hypothetical protein